MKWAVVFLFIGLVNRVHSQHYVKEYATGARIWEYEGGYLIDRFSNVKKLQLDENNVKEFSTGKILYRKEGVFFIHYPTGEIIYQFQGDSIIDYSTGNYIYFLDAEFLKDFKTGNRLYEIHGIFPIELILAAILQND